MGEKCRRRFFLGFFRRTLFLQGHSWFFHWFPAAVPFFRHVGSPDWGFEILLSAYLMTTLLQAGANVFTFTC